MCMSGALDRKPRSFSSLSRLHSPQSCKMLHDQQYYTLSKTGGMRHFFQAVNLELSFISPGTHSALMANNTLSCQ